MEAATAFCLDDYRINNKETIVVERSLIEKQTETER